jgi:hypothetical protein
MSTIVSESADGHVGSHCAHCPLRARAERHPNHFLSRFWRKRWHRKACPGWKMGRREGAKAA